MKSVIIVDDHNLMARSLEIMVNSFDDYTVREIFPNGKELLNYFRNGGESPDIILLDIKMPVMNGLETMSHLQKMLPEQKVITLSMEDDDKTVLSMIRLGVKGYLLKDVDPEEFYEALESVLTEGYYHSDFQLKTLEKQQTGNMEVLSAMEKQFLQLACTDHTYKEIAEEMGRSYKTIDGYREALFRKLDVRSRTGLAIYAIKHNLVNL